MKAKPVHEPLQPLAASQTDASNSFVSPPSGTTHPGDFERISEFLPLGIFRTDANGSCIYLNRLCSQISGLTLESAKGLNWLKAIHPEDRARIQNEWERSVREHRPFRSEYRFATPAGESVWVISQAVAEFDATGTLTGFVGTITDISELKRIEEALRISEARFRLAFGFAPHGMALVRPDGRFLQVNRLLCQMLGYSETELLRLRFHDVSHPDELDTSVAGIRALLDDQSKFLELEKRCVRKDGQLIWIQLRTSLVRDGAGQPLYFVSHMQDITERKSADVALQESEERYRRLVELSPNGILIHTGKKILFANPAAAKILGADSIDQFANVTVLDLVHPDSRDIVRERIRELRDGATLQPFIRETLLRFDGTSVPVEVAGIPFVYRGQSAVQVIIRDISQAVRDQEERERLFHEVEAARDRLQLLSQRLVEVQELERRRIARELHDEIGQELTALRLNIEQTGAMEATTAEARRKEALERVQRLMTFVRELSLDLRPTMLDDLGLLPALLWHFNRYTALSQIEVEFRHSGVEGRRFATEVETAAYRIIQEALTNVLRHSRAKNVTVRVWLLEPSPMLSIQVRDAGAGFNTEAALRAGLSSGLSGMRERVSLLGGTFVVESAPGRGACITADIPLEPEPFLPELS